ncbi:MAG: helix-turn-helix domain-containing protein [Anaerolineae bacterium]|nr:helix-turn-helix domain-containing protein [Anaerolineae bacterium]
MNDKFVLQDERLLDDVETIKVFADERRLKVLQLMNRPNTVKAVAAALDMPPSKLYYHVNLLVEHGLLSVVDHNIESGIVEKVYQVTARHFRLVNPLLAGDAMSADASAAVFGTLLDETRTGFLRALTDRDPAEGTPPRHPFLSQKLFRLTDDQLSMLHTRLDQLIQDVTAYGVENADSAEPTFALTVAFYKKPEDVVDDTR